MPLEVEPRTADMQDVMHRIIDLNKSPDPRITPVKLVGSVNRPFCRLSIYLYRIFSGHVTV